jgi:hypothetical protein
MKLASLHFNLKEGERLFFYGPRSPEAGSPRVRVLRRGQDGIRSPAPCSRLEPCRDRAGRGRAAPAFSPGHLRSPP